MRNSWDTKLLLLSGIAWTLMSLIIFRYLCFYCKSTWFSWVPFENLELLGFFDKLVDTLFRLVLVPFEFFLFDKPFLSNHRVFMGYYYLLRLWKKMSTVVFDVELIIDYFLWRIIITFNFIESPSFISRESTIFFTLVCCNHFSYSILIFCLS